MTDRATSDRRRVLDVALDRRPEMTIADLHQALDAIGIDVDTDTLVADLDALGYDVEAPGTDAAASLGPPPPAEPPVPDGSPGPDGPSGAEPWWQGRTGVMALAAAALVVALVVAAVVAGGDDDDVAADGGGERRSTAAGGAVTTAAAVPAPPGPVVTAPVGPGDDPELAAGVDGVSGFDEPVTDGLGTAPNEQPWAIVAGTWSVGDGVARLDAVEGDAGVGVVTFDPGLAAYRLQVRLGSLVGGNGLVFGAAGADDYYTFVAAPELSTFVLARVVDGERQIIDNSGLTVTEGGRAVIGVHVTPGQVEALVNGAVVLTVTVDGPLPGTAVGLGSVPGSQGGTFDEVSYRADP